MIQTILDVKNLSKSFGEGHTLVRAVDNISFSIAPGELVLVMGPSGSGKTTFLSMLGGLLRPSEGSICLEGRELYNENEKELSFIRSTQIGFIFQSFNLLEALTVEENILLPAQLSKEGLSQAKQSAQKLMMRLGLTKRRSALPKTLSGGEKQRVAIARALINKPKLILADEPTGNLDSESGQEIAMTIQQIAKLSGVAVLIVTHDPRLESIADRIYWLEDGALSEKNDETQFWVVDPICGMNIDLARTKFKTFHQQKWYGFCTKTCLRKFESQLAEGSNKFKNGAR